MYFVVQVTNTEKIQEGLDMEEAIMERSKGEKSK